MAPGGRAPADSQTRISPGIQCGSSRQVWYKLLGRARRGVIPQAKSPNVRCTISRRACCVGTTPLARRTECLDTRTQKANSSLAPGAPSACAGPPPTQPNVAGSRAQCVAGPCIRCHPDSRKQRWALPNRTLCPHVLRLCPASREAFSMPWRASALWLPPPGGSVLARTRLNSSSL